MANSVAAIGRSLVELSQQNEKKGKQTACLFNLIIYAHEERRVPYFDKLILLITEKFPCRILLIRSSEDPDMLQAQVASLDALQGTARAVCDQITFLAGKNRLKEIPFSLIPHLVSDLPIYLIWGRDPEEQDPILPILLKTASRLIIDSECASDLHAFSLRIIDWIEQRHLAILDINWAFISGWRNVFSCIFAIEDTLAELSRLKRINIVYNARQTTYCIHAEKQALYFQAWLASRLGWVFSAYDKKEHFVRYNDRAGKIIEVHFTALSKEELWPGAIIAIEAISERVELSFQRIGDAPQVLVHVTRGDTCDLPNVLQLTNVKAGLSFQTEIFYAPPSPQYAEMLRALGTASF